MTNYTYLGWGTTDSNGVAKLDHDANGDPISHSYTGTGVGEVDIVASLDDPNSISDSSLQSEPYSLWDTLKYDNATSNDHNDIWTMGSGDNTQLDRLTEYSTVSEITSGTDAFILTPVNHSFCIEFDVKVTSTNFGRSFAQLGQSANATTRSQIILPSAIRNNNWHHIKIKFNNGTGTISSESTSEESLTVSGYDSTMSMYFRFRTSDEISEINFKNFKYYSL